MPMAILLTSKIPYRVAETCQSNKTVISARRSQLAAGADDPSGENGG